MPTSTPRYGLPYQEPGDAPDGPALGQDLATAVETSLGAVEDRVDDQYAWIAQERFTASGAFTKASYAGARKVRVRVQGGGGAGGGAPATAASQVSAGGGGGGGAYAESWLDVAPLAANVTVTRGAGGTGVSGAAGNNGGTSSFGAHVSAPGGFGGGAVPAGGTAFTIAGGSGATGGTGDLLIGGQGGGFGTRLGSAAGQVLAGAGGSSHLGGGGAAGRNAVGDPGAGYGAGGGGSSNDPSLAAKAGPAGSNGIVIVDIYA